MKEIKKKCVNAFAFVLAIGCFEPLRSGSFVIQYPFCQEVSLVECVDDLFDAGTIYNYNTAVLSNIKSYFDCNNQLCF
jgi:hypothetical protein